MTKRAEQIADELTQAWYQATSEQPPRPEVVERAIGRMTHAVLDAARLYAVSDPDAEDLEVLTTKLDREVLETAFGLAVAELAARDVAD